MTKEPKGEYSIEIGEGKTLYMDFNENNILTSKIIDAGDDVEWKINESTGEIDTSTPGEDDIQHLRVDENDDLFIVGETKDGNRTDHDAPIPLEKSVSTTTSVSGSDESDGEMSEEEKKKNIDDFTNSMLAEEERKRKLAQDFMDRGYPE
jgi:hypothetical protein